MLLLARYKHKTANRLPLPATNKCHGMQISPRSFNASVSQKGRLLVVLRGRGDGGGGDSGRLR